MNWFLKQAARAQTGSKESRKSVAKQAAMQAEEAARRAGQAAQEAAMQAIEAPHMNEFTEPISNESSSPFSKQGTKLTDSTFADTIGLAMHNAINNQQQSQVTTAATRLAPAQEYCHIGWVERSDTKANRWGKVKPDGLVLHNPKTQ